MNKKQDLVGNIGVDEELLNNLMNEYLGLREPKDKIGRSYLNERRRVLWGRIRDVIKGSGNALRVKVYRETHPEVTVKQISVARAKHVLLKVEVLTHYGNGKLACVVCGENRIACLSIDHIHGGGNIHRKVLRSSGSFYKWLKSKGFPEGYQTLCMNDQFVKRFEKNEEHCHTNNEVDWQNA